MKQLKIGKRHKATGNCGMTDGIEVIGRYEKWDRNHIIWDEKTKLPCSVWPNTIEEK